ncbi:unnamed protein product [Arabis nemorensis]|uniref:Uncharacterized protein n=1 Tax=Arabis nemorensis TaxID=586526 RepID=A0A565AUG3_9BRAS|nr:unnamed protein product [Arabis nemorensis]
MTNFEVAKVFTEINLHKPIAEIVCAKFESGETARVEVYCPQLPPIYKMCNETILSHTVKRCPKAPPLCQHCKNAYHDQELYPMKIMLKQKVKDPEDKGMLLKGKEVGKQNNSGNEISKPHDKPVLDSTKVIEPPKEKEEGEFTIIVSKKKKKSKQTKGSSTDDSLSVEGLTLHGK